LSRKPLLIAVALGLGIAPCAGAGTILLTATAQGWMTATFNNGAYAANSYVAGNCGAGDCYTGEFRNYFEFAIPKLDGLIVSATLLLDTSYEAMKQSPSITYEVTSVPGTFGFSDLGAGTVYGSRGYTAVDQYRVEGIALDAAALADLQKAAGGTFTVGGRVTSPVAFGSAQPDELIFGRTAAPQRLEIVTGFAPMLLGAAAPVSAVPEPTPALLMLGGVLLIILARFKPRTGTEPRP
jgi:hypothetical protein